VADLGAGRVTCERGGHTTTARADRGIEARYRPDPDPAGGRGADSRAGDSAQPERPRADHRRQHDDAARASLQPWHGGDGRRRRVWRGRRRPPGKARVAMPKGRTAASPSTRSAPPSRPSRCGGDPLPGAAALYFPFSWRGSDYSIAPRRRGRSRTREAPFAPFGIATTRFPGAGGPSPHPSTTPITSMPGL